MIYNQYFHISSPKRLTSSGKNTVAEKLAVVYEEDMPVGQRWSSWHRAMTIIKRNDRFWWRVSSGDREETRSDNDCEDLWGGLFWHSWCTTNQIISSFITINKRKSSQRPRTSTTEGTFCSGREKLFHVCRSRRGCRLLKWSHTYVLTIIIVIFKTIADVNCSTSSSRHLQF